MINKKITKEYLIKLIIDNQDDIIQINLSPFTQLLWIDWYYYDNNNNNNNDNYYSTNKFNRKYIINFKNRLFGTVYSKYPEELSKKQLIKIAQYIKQPTKLLFYD